MHSTLNLFTEYWQNVFLIIVSVNCLIHGHWADRIINQLRPTTNHNKARTVCVMREIPSNLKYKAHQIRKFKRFSSWLADVFAQHIETSYLKENEDVVGAVSTGDAPTTSEWAILWPTKCALYLRFDGRWYSKSVILQVLPEPYTVVVATDSQSLQSVSPLESHLSHKSSSGIWLCGSKLATSQD